MKLYRLLNYLPGARTQFNRKLEAVVVLSALVPPLLYYGVMRIMGDPPDLGLVLLLVCLGQAAALIACVLLRLLLAPLDQLEDILQTRRVSAVQVQALESQDLLARLVRDAADLVQRQEQAGRHIQATALHDDLTGLYTRAAIKRRLVEDCARADRSQMSLHVAFVRLTGLDDIARKHGPGESDAMLRLAADLMRASIRKADWVGRWKSDVFILGFCDNLQLESTLTRDITKLGESAHTTAGGEAIALSVYCGAAQYLPGTGARNVLTSAGTALEAASHLGPTSRRFVIARPTPEQPVDSELLDFLDT
jgi:diguanylate cyclase (GGDEF)-like protein